MIPSLTRGRAANILFTTAAVIICLYPARFVLEAQQHPLLLQVTARDTADAAAVYKKINQVHATVRSTPRGPVFSLSHSVPDFESYSIRTSPGGAWRRWRANEVSAASGPDGTALLYIKAHNCLGGETAVFTFTASGSADAAPGMYLFEDCDAPGIALFRRYTLPAVEGRRRTWDRALAVFAWASNFLQAGDETQDFRSQPVAMLQERLRNPRSRFLCGSFAVFFIAACHSVGVNARLVHLTRRNGEGHYVAEVWSDQHQKWIAMDPMYKRVFCDAAACCSALDLRSAYLASIGGQATAWTKKPGEQNYLSLYDDMHYFTSNAFFSSHPASFWSLAVAGPPVLHWCDGLTPPFYKGRAVVRLFLFYYLPRGMKLAALPAALIVSAYLLAALWRTKKKRHTD